MSSEGSIKLPPEIVTDILYRLPEKSLGRFRCVSKDWLSLISEPQFIRTHQNTHNQNHLIFFSNDHSLYSLPFHQQEADAALRPRKLRFEPHYIDFTLYGSCNGLVLVSAHDFDAVHTLVVLNPTTRDFVELPKSNYKVINDSLEIEIMYGFGYDSLADDYKVVSISYFHNNYLIPPDRMSVHVYSLRTNTWRWVTDSPYDHSFGRSAPGVLVNGFLHWVAKNGSDHSSVIVAFSLADEKFSEVPSPDLCINVDFMSRNDCKLSVLGGKLGIVLNGVEGEVWVMNEYGVSESWTQVLNHGRDEISMVEVEPMFLDDNDKILLVFSDLVLIYNVEERTFCKNVALSRNLKDLKIRGTYVESLVSPKFSNGNEEEIGITASSKIRQIQAQVHA